MFFLYIKTRKQGGFKMSVKSKRTKQIKLKDIQKQHKKVHTMSTYVLNEEENLIIQYYKQFPEERIHELMEELYSSVKFVEENNLNFFQKEEQLIQFAMFLMIRKFTSLESEIPTNFETQVSIMSQIISIGLWDTIFEEVLPPDEVNRVLEKFKEYQLMVEKIGHTLQQELSVLDEKVQNPEVLHPLVNPPTNTKVID